jgi:hypothetical protein
MDASKISGAIPLPTLYQQAQTNTQVKPAVDTAQQQQQTGKTSSITIKDQVQTATSVTLKNLDAVKAIESLHAKMNQLVKGVRETNEALDKAAVQVETMKTGLNTILKNFPPFPIDSKERQATLMSYTSIREEIIKMTVPTPPQPIYEKIKTMWESAIAPAGQIKTDSVANLQTTSSDSEVAAAYTSLDKTGDNLATLSSGITQALIKQ